MGVTAHAIRTMGYHWGFLHSEQCEETLMEFTIYLGLMGVAVAVYAGAYQIAKALDRIADIADRGNH